VDFEKLLRDSIRNFPNNGSFVLQPGQDVRSQIKEGGVPDEPGIYLICGTKGETARLMYIGKAGTLKKDGSFRDQMLCGRLSAKQEGISRQKFYQEKMAELQLDHLLFYWFVTFNSGIRIIPAKAEADLIQKYFDDNGYLPPWNVSV
jgi:hypothetical protein